MEPCLQPRSLNIFSSPKDGGGANTDPEGTPERLGITIQYTQPFLRPNENQVCWQSGSDVNSVTAANQTSSSAQSTSPSTLKTS